MLKDERGLSEALGDVLLLVVVVLVVVGMFVGLRVPKVFEESSDVSFYVSVHGKTVNAIVTKGRIPVEELRVVVVNDSGCVCSFAWNGTAFESKSPCPFARYLLVNSVVSGDILEVGDCVSLRFNSSGEYLVTLTDGKGLIQSAYIVVE